MKKPRLTTVLSTISLLLNLIPMLVFVIFRVDDITFLIALLSPISFIISLFGVIYCLATIKSKDATWVSDLLIFLLSLVLSLGYCFAMWSLIKLIYSMINNLIITF